MNNIFSQHPNNLIMEIIKMETIRKHEQEFEDYVNDLVYYGPEPDEWDAKALPLVLIDPYGPQGWL